MKRDPHLRQEDRRKTGLKKGNGKGRVEKQRPRVGDSCLLTSEKCVGNGRAVGKMDGLYGRL